VTAGSDEEVLENDTGLDDEAAANMARDVLEYLAKSIVDDPDGVTIDVEEGRRGDVRLSLHVSAGDMGKVIGRRGRVAQAIRTVVRAAGSREGVEVGVDIVD
jgi:predicted RNA-binding protein YlqC (UPF0109 family)